MSGHGISDCYPKPGFQPGRMQEGGNRKEVQFQMFTAVPQGAGVAGCVAFSDKTHSQYLYLYIGLNDRVQISELG